MTTATEPTLLEQIQALKTTAHRLATERDEIAAENEGLLKANADLLETNADLQQEADRARSKVRVGVEVNRHLREELNARNRELRLVTADRDRIAIRCSDLEQRVDADQQLVPDTRRKWRFLRFGRLR